MKVKSFVMQHKKLVIAAAAFAAVVMIFAISAGGRSAALVEETPERRNIHTYKSFSGNVEPATNTTIYSKVSQQATQVLVEEGDTVKAGDVIAVIDDTTVRQNIAKYEVSLSTSKTSNAYNISDAQRNYDNYKEALDCGLNTSLNTAYTAMDSARTALSSAKEDRDTTLQSIDSGTYPDTQTLYDARAAAQAAYDTAKTAYDAAKTAYDAAPEENAAALETAKATLDSAEAALQTAQTAFEQARETIRAAKQAAVDSAQKSYDTARDSYDAAELAAEQQLEAYKAALDKAKATATTASTELELNQLRNSLADYTICAPCDGTVTALNIVEGSMVSGGTGIATISNLSAMKVAISVDEYAILDTGEGSTVTISFDSIGRTYTGTITKVADIATLNNGVSYFAAEVVFEADEYVKSGMSVEVRLTTTDKMDVLTVSADALHYDTENAAYVLVKNGSTQEQRSVETGATDGNYVEILSGLSEEDTVLVTPSSDDMFSEMTGGRP